MVDASNPTASTIRIQRMLNARRPPVMTQKLTPIVSKPLAMPHIRLGKAEGGLVDSPAAPVTGPVVTATGGRTDAHPVHVPSGAYVIPADVVSHIGEGNSLAGMKLLTMMFGAPWQASGGPLGATMPKVQRGPGVRGPTLGRPNAPYPALAPPMPKPGAMIAHGGHVHDDGSATPIMISGGEFVVTPDEVTRRGGGNHDKGCRALDAWVVHLRKKSIDTLKKLPGPAR